MRKAKKSRDGEVTGRRNPIDRKKTYRSTPSRISSCDKCAVPNYTSSPWSSFFTLPLGDESRSATATQEKESHWKLDVPRGRGRRWYQQRYRLFCAPEMGQGRNSSPSVCGRACFRCPFVEDVQQERVKQPQACHHTTCTTRLL